MTDTERLDFLQNLLGSYTGKAVLRMSTTGLGFRLHETSRKTGVTDISVAIDNYFIESGAKK